MIYFWYKCFHNTILYNTYYLGSVPGSGNCCLTFGSFSNKPPSATPLRKALTCKWQGTKSATDLFDHMFLLLYTYQYWTWFTMCTVYVNGNICNIDWKPHVNIYTGVLPYVAVMFCQFQKFYISPFTKIVHRSFYLLIHGDCFPFSKFKSHEREKAPYLFAMSVSFVFPHHSV